MLTLLVRGIECHFDSEAPYQFLHFLGHAENVDRARDLIKGSVKKDPGFVWHEDQLEIIAYQQADYPGEFRDIPNALTTVIADWDAQKQRWSLFK